MPMVDLKSMRTAIAKGLKEYLSIPVIRGDQTAEQPAYPFCSYTITTAQGKNDGTYQQHEDGIDRLYVTSIWSFSFLSEDFDESVMLASKAREWFLNSGQVWLSDHEITVQSATAINNRDNILTVEYERKNGFDVVFYVYDEAPSIAQTAGYIESAEITNTMQS